MAGLTAKQSAFVEAYCANGFNATQAAIAARYSEKTAQRMGSENLSKPLIAKAIKEFKAKATDKALVTTEDVVKGLLEEARGKKCETKSSDRIAAWKALGEFTGGFDANKQKTELTGKDGAPIEVDNKWEVEIVHTNAKATDTK